MGSLSCRCALLLSVPVLVVTLLMNSAGAQGLPSFAGPRLTGTPAQATTPSNPLAAPGSAFGVPPGSDTVQLSSGMFSGIMPPIPNLEFGFLYNFGNRIRSGRFTADYVLPFSLSIDSVLFGEAHTEWQDFWRKPSGGTNNRIDLSLGGGYRRIFNDSLLLGVNGFYDSSRLFGTWSSSGSVGLEMAALTAGGDAIDLNLNYYGNIFTRDGLINAFRNKGGSYDVEAGYSHPLFNQALDLRLKLAGYQFNIGNAVYGLRGGADLTTRDGVFTVRYEHGQDKINGSYDTIGGFVNIGFDLANLLSGESPFTMPQPVFKSPRNLRRLLTNRVHRNWHQPSAVVGALAAAGGQGLDLFAVLITIDSCTTWPVSYTPPGVQATWLAPVLSSAEAQSAKRIVVSFTVYNNTTDLPVLVGLGNSATFTGFLAGSPLFPAGANGTFTFELTPGQFVQDVDIFIVYSPSGPPTPGTGFCFRDVVARFYR